MFFRSSINKLSQRVVQIKSMNKDKIYEKFVGASTIVGRMSGIACEVCDNHTKTSIVLTSGLGSVIGFATSASIVHLNSSIPMSTMIKGISVMIGGGYLLGEACRKYAHH